MIIYTNEGNPLGLKLVACAKLGNVNVTVKKVTLNGKYNHNFVQFLNNTIPVI